MIELVGYLFQGRELDAEMGNYYFRNRYYNPEMGRWLQRDPLGYVDSKGLYEAMGNSPYIISDTFGLQISRIYCVLEKISSHLTRLNEVNFNVETKAKLKWLTDSRRIKRLGGYILPAINFFLKFYSPESIIISDVPKIYDASASNIVTGLAVFTPLGPILLLPFPTIDRCMEVTPEVLEEIDSNILSVIDTLVHESQHDILQKGIGHKGYQDWAWQLTFGLQDARELLMNLCPTDNKVCNNQPNVGMQITNLWQQILCECKVANQ